MINAKDYRGNVYNIVSRVAYFIGVEEKLFKDDNDITPIKTEDNLLQDVFDELEQNDSAKIFRSLNIIRTNLLKNFKDISARIYYDMKNLDKLPEYINQDALTYLAEKGILVQEPGKLPLYYIVKLTRLINTRALNIVKESFPVWINPDYVKKLFHVKCSTEKDAKKLVQKFASKIACYPYQMYINFDKDCGNILYNDEKFVHLLYEANKDSFQDESKICDVAAGVKENLLDFMEKAGDIYILVDCENTNVYKLYSMLVSLKKDYPLQAFQKIKKIELYDDINTTSAWKLLQRFTNLKIEHIMIERVKEDKSLVDIHLSAGACKAFYKEGIKDFILASSDSDFFGLISSLPDCNFQVVVEKESVSEYALDALSECAAGFCYVDDFCTSELEPLYADAIKLEINQFLEYKTYVDLNRLFVSAVHNARLDMSESEINSYLKKYSRDMHIKRNGDHLCLAI